MQKPRTQQDVDMYVSSSLVGIVNPDRSTLFTVAKNEYYGMVHNINTEVVIEFNLYKISVQFKQEAIKLNDAMLKLKEGDTHWWPRSSALGAGSSKS